MVTTPESSDPAGPTPPEPAGLKTPEPSLALLSNGERIEVLRQRAADRRSTGEIPDRFGARVDQHFNKILQHVRPVDDTDDPLIAAAALLRTPRDQTPRDQTPRDQTPRARTPAEPNRLSKAKRRLETLGVHLDRSERERAERDRVERERVERERVEALEQTVLALIDRVRDLERREHRVTALTDRVDELQWKVRKLRRNERAARAPLPHEPEDLEDDSFDDNEFEASQTPDPLDDGLDHGFDNGFDGFDDTTGRASETGSGSAR
jgi:hypothetical protein